MRRGTMSDTIDEARIREVLESVMDPEIPVVSIVDLGMLREVRRAPDGGFEVILSPTYTGCPATDVIKRLVEEALERAGISDPVVRYQLSPPWTTEWISEEGRRKLARYGIAPPVPKAAPDRPVACPRCGSEDTEVVAAFGSTPCKSAMRCRACLEPFEHFKCH
ncbi:MAG: phenylacetate-CoA oxygenase subunit PaaJ [Alphaproteobacteria bacterium]|nr:MAG: phenylacetate-CoA oxygenase subunit PaaJ [Alphaproteobacteria bacterium]